MFAVTLSSLPRSKQEKERRGEIRRREFAEAIEELANRAARGRTTCEIKKTNGS
jgi:hypothetical protein